MSEHEARSIGAILEPILDEARTRIQKNGGDPMNATSTMPTPELLTAEQASAMLQIGTRSLWRKDASGMIPQALKIGKSKRWRARELLDWIGEGCPPRHRWKWKPKK